VQWQGVSQHWAPAQKATAVAAVSSSWRGQCPCIRHRELSAAAGGTCAAVASERAAGGQCRHRAHVPQLQQPVRHPSAWLATTGSDERR